MTTEQGQKAPFLTVNSMTQRASRTILSRAGADGPLLIGNYKSSCASSKQMFPFLERLNERHRGEG